MSRALPEERAAEIRRADIEVQGWLQTMFSAREALQSAVAGREHANFGGMLQAFTDLPEGASLEVVPQKREVLQACQYDFLTRHTALGVTSYYPHLPFRGGALIIAELAEVAPQDRPEGDDLDQALIGLNFRCLKPGRLLLPRGIAVNQVMEGVFVPGLNPFETTFTVADKPVRPRK